MTVTSDGFVELQHADAGDIVEQVEQVVMECEDADAVEEKLSVVIPAPATDEAAKDDDATKDDEDDEKDSPVAVDAAKAETKTTPTSDKKKKKKKKKKGKK
ncbi:hypothetical protein SDRG_05251 [Saprolegnia diclina VS20]|uniref:Uncharacterized protein n=1 Tax=Saprolegnia diclina (strain VS20) TaxID=1156394 RepID=T0RYK5_SAPDV|nr:hypothetical protein SDRG_05251 [Saprolegnia diclina VS20]EQC37663.1 hypothetical protein SDRG_05251 [Saprolegnia diclina VS20]|eukprot:XP_008609183.1 hypothetical protein SDRG_05251 [Saprolegnia diclina VS20]